MNTVIYVNANKFIENERDIEITMFQILFGTNQVNRLESLTVTYSGRNLVDLMRVASDHLQEIAEVNLGEVYDMGIAAISEVRSVAKCTAAIANFITIISNAIANNEKLTVAIRRA